MSKSHLHEFFGKPIKTINLGLEGMAEGIEGQNSDVTRVNWSPPPQVVPNLIYTNNGTSIDDANDEACRRINQSQAVLVGMGIAKDVIPGMREDMILHAGPPITWERMCGPTRGAVMGALVYEGFAKDEREAEGLAASGEFTFEPCHHHNTVGPMAGIVSPNMPVFIIENPTYNMRAYATQNEGLGKVLRYGGMGRKSTNVCIGWKKSYIPRFRGRLKAYQRGLTSKASSHRHFTWGTNAITVIAPVPRFSEGNRTRVDPHPKES